MPESEVWRKDAGKRGLEERCRKVRLGGKVPESEVWGAGKRGSEGAGKRGLEEGCRKARLGGRGPESAALRVHSDMCLSFFFL